MAAIMNIPLFVKLVYHEYNKFIQEGSRMNAIVVDSQRCSLRSRRWAIRAYWSVENRLHWCMDAVFDDNKMYAYSGYAARNPGS